MKKLNILFIAVGTVFTLASCSDFLDTMPDNRAEVDTEAKITSLLVSAYPNKYPGVMMEFASDNVMDNGKQYTVRNIIQSEVYLWQDITYSGNDDPKYIWQTHYSSIASANQALQAIEELGDPASLAPQKAEALLCRAYCHFVLSSVFCKGYNPETADKDMGLPYSMKPETQVVVEYTRGTMAELYKNIYNDIEAALPYISDDIYSIPKYHFNQRAAYAFAARFNLFYVQPDKSNYNKVVEYASRALGSNPEALLRNYVAYQPLGRTDIGNAYVQASEAANFLIIPAYSILGRLTQGDGPRYNASREILTRETYWSSGTWGSSGSGDGNFFYPAKKLYGSGGDGGVFPKSEEFWEDAGFAHVVTVPFTADETLLCRAEAYTFLEKYDEATADLNRWQKSHCAPTRVVSGQTYNLQPLTREKINSFFGPMEYTAVPLVLDGGRDRTLKKKLNPLGFTVEAGEQENFVHCVLYFRRLETMLEGQRWNDIKRYGIEFSHNRDGLSPDVLKLDDPRRVFQIPTEVIDAGLEPNPR